MKVSSSRWRGVALSLYLLAATQAYTEAPSRSGLDAKVATSATNLIEQSGGEGKSAVLPAVVQNRTLHKKLNK